MKTQLLTYLPDGARAAVAPLWKAFVCAQDLKIDPWEFALPLTHLIDLGVDICHLRWLVLRGYVTFRDRARRFQFSANLAASGDPRFMITGTGVLAAGLGREEAGAPSGRCSNSAGTVSLCSQMPKWDGEIRVLYLGQQIVKRYLRPSPNQDVLLSAFEEEGWPCHIDDPFPLKGEIDPKRRLHDTLKWLNRYQENRLLRFSGDGRGEGIRWEALVADELPTLADAPERGGLPTVAVLLPRCSLDAPQVLPRCSLVAFATRSTRLHRIAFVLAKSLPVVQVLVPPSGLQAVCSRYPSQVHPCAPCRVHSRCLRIVSLLSRP
jgi:hypothetical protein